MDTKQQFYFAQLDLAADFDTMKGAVLKALNQLKENEK